MPIAEVNRIRRDDLLPEVGRLIRYACVGGLAVVIDVVVLVILHSALNLDLVVATTIAYLVALAVHYLLNRNWAFKSDDRHVRQLPRYVVVVGIELALTLGIVEGLTHAGLGYLPAKLVAVAATSSLNFLLFRNWVFQIQPETLKLDGFEHAAGDGRAVIT